MRVTFTLIAFLACTALLLPPTGAFPQAGEELRVMDRREFPKPETLLPDYLTKIAFELLDARERGVSALTTAEDLKKRQAHVREQILRAIGGLPERTPLNPRLAGTLHRNGHDIEKVVFESQPGFLVTANLYIPTVGKPPFPAILFPLGHEPGAKAHDAWQRLLITFAKNGFVALTYDPIGQGERIQLYDADLKGSKVVQSTTEHTIIGIQCLLTGQNLARYTIWDAMRALDYLLTRGEVDPKRIGLTGNSGGGTMTAYLSALDERIAVAAPSCYITSWRRLLETIGPQDAEQNMPPFLLSGLDQVDFVEAFAPKPYLILSAIRDFFSIDGARESYREARRFYALAGAPDRIEMFEADDGHGYTRPRRLAAYRWMNRWLAGSDKPIPEPEILTESEETLWCTPSGQLAGSETVFALNQKRADALLAARRSETSASDFRQRVIRQTGSQIPGGMPPVRKLGELGRAGYRIERLLMESPGEVPLPALLFLPEQRKGKQPAILYLHEGGKPAQAGVGGQIEELVLRGTVVLAIDLPGMGETAESGDGWASSYFGSYDSAMKALLVGGTLVGIRTRAALQALNLLSARPEVDAARISGLGTGTAAVVLLHAAAMDDRLASVGLSRMLVSYDAVVRHRIHRNVFESVVPGVLEHYDLPDLAASLAPRRVSIIDAVDPLGLVLRLEEAEKAYASAREAYVARNAEKALRVITLRPGQKLTDQWSP